MGNTLKDNVDNFLKTQGFPFEMEVAKAFQEQKFGIHQSVYYNDVNTGIAREMDVIAMWNHKKMNKNMNIVFVIECKFANSPWVLFSSVTRGFPQCYIQNARGRHWVEHLTKQDEWNNLFVVDENYGHGLTQVFKNRPKQKENTQQKEEGLEKEDNSQKNNAYAAIQSLLSFIKAESSSARFNTIDDYTFYVPVIAIKGHLFSASLTDNNVMETKEINEAQLIIKENIAGIIPKIHIITHAHLAAYIAQLRKHCELLGEAPLFDISIINTPLARL